MARAKQQQNEIAIPDNTHQELSSYFFKLGQSVRKGDTFAMWNNFVNYSEMCLKNKIRMTPINAFMVMGLDLDEAKAILQKKLYSDSPEMYECVQRVKTFVMADIELAGALGEIPPTVLIWWQKNFAGMSDFPEQQTIEYEEDDIMTPQEIADKYKDILD